MWKWKGKKRVKTSAGAAIINATPLIVTQDKRKSVKVKGKKRVKVKGKKIVKTNASAAINNANPLIVTQEEKNEKQSKNKWKQKESENKT